MRQLAAEVELLLVVDVIQQEAIDALAFAVDAKQRAKYNKIIHLQCTTRTIANDLKSSQYISKHSCIMGS